MEKDNSIKPKYNRLLFKMYTSFAVVISIFAVLLGV